MARPREKPPQAVKTLERGLRVLGALAQAGESPLGPLAERVGLAKSTLYRLLRALAQAGFVEEEGGVYRVGPKAFAVGQAYPKRSLSQAVRPEMEALARETGESVNLAVPLGREALYLDQVEGTKLVRLFTAPGSRAPLHATGVGKVFLAYLGVPEGLSLTPYTPTPSPGFPTSSGSLRRCAGGATPWTTRRRSSGCGAWPPPSSGPQGAWWPPSPSPPPQAASPWRRPTASPPGWWRRPGELPCASGTQARYSV